MKINASKSVQQCTDIAFLEKECFPEDPWSLESIEGFLKSSIRYGFILQEDQNALGYVILTSIEHELEIERLGIALSHRKNGLGKFLLTKVLELLEAERCYLDVSDKNTGAINLYKSCGFESVGRRSAYYHDGSDAVLMEWKR